MFNPLPARIEHALDDWRLWPLDIDVRPHVTRMLVQGKTNDSVLISAAKQQLVLRIESENAHVLGINREREIAIVKAIAPLNLGPQLIYRCAQQGYALFRYYPGRQWTLDDYRNRQQRQRLDRLLHTLQHAAPVKKLLSQAHPQGVDYNTAYLHQLRQYQQQLSVRGLKDADLSRSAFEVFFSALADKLAANTTKHAFTLCHHDLVPENIIEGDSGIRLLDWEYAGFGLPDFDACYIAYLVNGSSAPMPSGSLTEQLIYWLCRYWFMLQRSDNV